MTDKGLVAETVVAVGSEQKLRAAMKRLFDGTPIRTDGRLTKSNLHIEAGVSRATMNRASAVLEEWNAAARDTRPRDSKYAALEREAADLRATISRLRKENAELSRKNQAAVTINAELNAELRALRGMDPTGTIVPLVQPRAPRAR